MRLLVTGGAGTLGRELVRRAVGKGWDVRATWFSKQPDLPGEWLRTDVRDSGAVSAALAGVDAVVHTAYVQGGPDEWTTNVDGSRIVAEAARAVRLVHVSSDLVFDGTRGRYLEHDNPGPVSAYGRSKLESERQVAAVHPAATIVRTSLIYGGTEPGPQERLAHEGTRFFVDELRSPVQVGDLAEALLELVGLAAGGPLHLGGADDISRFDFAVLLGADPEQVERGHTTRDRAPNVTLDSSRAAGLLATRLRGVYEVLDSSSAVRSAR